MQTRDAFSTYLARRKARGALLIAVAFGILFLILTAMLLVAQQHGVTSSTLTRLSAGQILIAAFTVMASIDACRKYPGRHPNRDKDGSRS